MNQPIFIKKNLIVKIIKFVLHIFEKKYLNLYYFSCSWYYNLSLVFVQMLKSNSQSIYFLVFSLQLMPVQIFGNYPLIIIYTILMPLANILWWEKGEFSAHFFFFMQGTIVSI